MGWQNWGKISYEKFSEYWKVNRIGDGFEEWTVIEIKKYKMKDVHMDLEKAALMIREFKATGNPG